MTEIFGVRDADGRNRKEKFREATCFPRLQMRSMFFLPALSPFFSINLNGDFLSAFPAPPGENFFSCFLSGPCKESVRLGPFSFLGLICL